VGGIVFSPFTIFCVACFAFLDPKPDPHNQLTPIQPGFGFETLVLPQYICYFLQSDLTGLIAVLLALCAGQRVRIRLRCFLLLVLVELQLVQALLCVLQGWLAQELVLLVAVVMVALSL